MVILEGMDGSGKTHLLNDLCSTMGLTKHARACTSEGGPIENLYEWAKNDIETWHTQPFAVYDRHPFISEHVYGPLVRGWVDPRFHSVEARELIKRMAFNCTIILCDPGIPEIMRNVKRTANMKGVGDFIHELSLTYRSLFQFWPAPLRVLRWDYANPGNFDTIKHMVAAQQVAHERLTINA